MEPRDLPPVHPGEILLEDFLKPLNITRYRLAKSIGVPQRRIDEICAGKRAITAETALRLARFFGADAQSWLNLQSHYDLECLESRMADKIDRRALVVGYWIVIDRCAEVGDHPQVDGVLAVIALPVRYARPCHCRTEAVGLRDGEHGDESAIAPACQADTIAIHGILLGVT